MGVAEDVIAALSGGGTAVARMEIARLVNAAVARLAGRAVLDQDGQRRPARQWPDC